MPPDDVRSVIMRPVAAPKVIDTSGYPLTPESFNSIASRVLLQRGWELESVDETRATGQHVRHNLIYRVQIEMQPGEITIAFLPGYGSDRPNYLRNLQHDIMVELQMLKIQKR